MIAFSKSLKNKLSMIYVFKEKIKPAVNSLKAFRIMYLNMNILSKKI